MTCSRLYIYYTQEELEHLQGEQWAKTEASISKLLSEKNELAEELCRTRHSLQVHSDGWRRERSKATALMFSESWSLHNMHVHTQAILICRYNVYTCTCVYIQGQGASKTAHSKCTYAVHVHV